METWRLLVLLTIFLIPWGFVIWYKVQLVILTRYTNKLLDQIDSYWEGNDFLPQGRTKGK